MNAPLRQFISPYARKLAEQRGIVLADLGGSGPSGRIVAADVLSFVNRAIAVEDIIPLPVASAATAMAVSAIATQIDVGKARDLLSQFADAKLPLSLNALFVRAAARNLAAIDVKVAIGWETGTARRDIRIDDGVSLSLGAIQARIESEDGAVTASNDPAFVSIRHFQQSSVRAVSMPLLPGHRMRLVISIDSLDRGDCLLCFDTDNVAEDDAITFLAQLKDDLEMPLRLLA
jgi:pyruvate dehydrogenase E2 component (dihydrolipoamide acetyltransferase)